MAAVEAEHAAQQEAVRAKFIVSVSFWGWGGGRGGGWGVGLTAFRK